MNEVTVKIITDATPVLTFMSLFQSAIKRRKLFLKPGEFPFEACRVETDKGPASAGEFHMTLYPSDTLLRFAAAKLTRKRHFMAAKGADHA
jgi:hypothetical protein